jgi:hypothetical protein
MVLNSPKYRIYFQSVGGLGACRLPHWQWKGTQSLGDAATSRYGEKAENRRIGWALLGRKLSYLVDNTQHKW